MAARLKPVSFKMHPSFKTKIGAELYEDCELPPLPNAVPYTLDDPQARSNTRVMSREEEQLRFLTLNFAKFRMNFALKQKRYSHYRQYESRMKHMQEFLCRMNMPLVYSQVARSHTSLMIDESEAQSETQMALMRCVNLFDCSRGFKFSTYAVSAILKAMSRLSAKTKLRNGRFCPVELPAELETEFPDKKRDEALAGRLEGLGEILKSNAACLTQQEHLIISRRFELEGSTRLTLEECGEILGFTKERVRQLQNRALKKLREAIVAKEME